MNSWNGRLTLPFEQVKCDGVFLDDLVKMEKKQKVYIIDWRLPEHFFNDGHIPGSINGYGKEGKFGGIEDMLRGYFRFKPIYIELMRDNAVAAFISYDEPASIHRCRIEKWATGIENMYFLKGNIDNWNTPLEKEPWTPVNR